MEIETDLRDVYWATLPTKEVGDAIMHKVESYHEHLVTSGRLGLIKRSYNQYYNALRTGAMLERVGAQGQYSSISVNDFRNILLHLITMTSNERQAFEPQAVNTDQESIAQVTLAGGLLDFYLREKRLERKMKKTLETCLWAADAFIALGWDTEIGEEYAAGEDGKVQRLGDIDVRTYTPMTCVRDHTLHDPERETWKVLIDFENRYELAARFPELRERILSVSKEYALDKHDMALGQSAWEDSDIIPVFEFRHEKTPAVPNGRLVRLIDSDIILIDNDLPYKKIHVYRMAPSEQEGSINGYSIAFDLLPIQEACDALNSVCLTNISTFAVQNVAVPMGSSLNIVEVTEGLNLIEFDPASGPPIPLSLLATPPETYNYMDRMISAQERLSAVNKVTRGQADAMPQLKSGAALAMVQSMAIAFTSDLQQSYTESGEDVGTGIIELLQTFATLPRVAQIVGKSNKGLLKHWTSKDISLIRRVVITKGNPLMKTTAGKVNLAEQLLNAGMIENPDQLLQVYNSGKIEPMTEGKLSQLNLIRDENEAMSEGRPVFAVITDNHDQHILEHQVVLASTEARQDPQLVTNVTKHIMEHLELKRTQDPIIAQLYKQIPAMPMGAPPQGQLPQGTQGNVSLPQPPQPQMPTNPLTGQEFDPQTGGL